MSTPRSFPADRAAAFKASTRQQAAYKALNAANDPARTTFDDVLGAMDAHGHEGRIEATPKKARAWTTSEWALEQERRAREREVNPNAFAFYGPGV